MIGEIPIREKNIVLIGFMGVGKTTIGTLVAKKLYRGFIDIDKEIEDKCNMPITQIFEDLGEKKFREIERDLIIDTCLNTRLNVISLGGGAYLQEEVRKICLSHCIVFFLDLSWDSWQDRIPLIIDNRPVLQNKTIEEIEQVFRTRRTAYSLHNSKISTDNLNPEEVADYIVESLKLAWDIYQPHND
ncbi:shikimate kinase [Effusibacillus consociatus]|uniref:Shikimate kinase n=1 Tax=Effusibacillus consociatus TaxID=1117041 RepID=A0ABV9Q6Z1_9BACL